MSKEINYEELFKLFCGYGKPEWTQTPSTYAGHHMATDSHTAIILPEDKAPALKFSEERRSVGLLRVTPESHTHVIMSVAEIKSQMVTEMEDETISNKCGECNGDGVVEWEYKNHTKEFDCPNCNGYGDFTRKTGNKVPNRNHRYKMMSAYYRYDVLSRLIKAAEMIGVFEVTMLAQSKDKATKFQVGDFTILLMPYLACEDDEVDEIKLSVTA